MDGLSTMRYAHSDGYTGLCYNDTGKTLITCGTDGDIRIWNGFEDDDPVSHHIGENVSYVTFKEGKLYVSSDTFSVVAYSFPNIEFEEIVAQFNSYVSQIVCNKNGQFVASGGGDTVVKMYDTSTKTLVAFRGHDSPVLSIAFDPFGSYLATSSCDGKVCIWKLIDQSCIKTFKIFKKSNDISTAETLCRLEWSTEGEYLAIPVECEIHFYERETWECKFKLKDECISKNLSIITFSACGMYMAAAAVNGQMIVWDMKKKTCISKKMHEKGHKVCSLVWNPSGKELAFCDVEGQLGIYDNATALSEPVDQNFQDLANFDDFGDSMDEDDADDFDIGAIKAKLEPKIFGTEVAEDEEEKESVVTETSNQAPKTFEIPKAPLQTAFQPSSTPVNLEHRFMLWNTVGIVRCYNTEEENTIDVEFHDVNVYHPLHLNNTRNHTMAALSTEALLLASPKYGDTLSKLECLHFGTWDSNKEWIVEMQEDEEIEAIALGEGWAVAITDLKLVRLFTISGVQCEVFSIPGPIVCCTASNNELLIAYHKGIGIDDSQFLGLMVVNIRLGSSVVKDYPLPLHSKSFLYWLGHTDEKRPCIADTSGAVHLLTVEHGVKWIQIANTSTHSKVKSNSYFIIGLSEIKQEIRCILCKGSRYPSLLPKPTVSIVPFTLPFCEMMSDKGRFEEENARCSLTCDCLKSLLNEGYDLTSEHKSAEKKWMDILLKMFALATRSEREYRALDIAQLMPNPKVVEGALRYATQRHCMALAERLSQVMAEKIESTVEYTPHHSLRSSICNGDDETVLQPKPLLQNREISKPQENFEDSENSVEKPESSHNTGLLSAKSSPLINPFKANVKPKLSERNSKGDSVGIDNILKSSAKNAVTTDCSLTEKKSSKQSKLLHRYKDGVKRKSKETVLDQPNSGFKLYLHENREKILAENPSMNSDEINRKAIGLYKALSDVDRKEYEKRSTAESSGTSQEVNGSLRNEEENGTPEEPSESTSGSPSTSTGTTKRKSMDGNDLSKPKKAKVIKESISNKLTKFAFTKQSG